MKAAGNLAEVQDWRFSAKALVTGYAKRMVIENALSDAVRFFHINALSSAVGLKVG